MLSSRGRYDEFDFDIESNTAFPGKLFLLIEGSTDHSVVSWLPNGLSFSIFDQARFAEMLPRYFKHKKISSFQRQLNLYGFRRDKVQSSYFHPKFQRGRRDLISSIRRIPTKGAASAEASVAKEDAPTAYLRNGKQTSTSSMLNDNSSNNDIMNPFNDGISQEVFNTSNVDLLPDSWMNVHHHINGASGVNLKRGRLALGASEYVPASSLKEPLRRIPLPHNEPTTDKESVSSDSSLAEQVQDPAVKEKLSDFNKEIDMGGTDISNQMKVKKSKITANIGYYKYVKENQLRELGVEEQGPEDESQMPGPLPNRRWGSHATSFAGNPNDFIPTAHGSSSDLRSLSSLEVGDLFSNGGDEELLYLSQSTLNAMQENHKDEFALGGSSMAVTADRVYYGHKGKEDSYSDNYF